MDWAEGGMTGKFWIRTADCERSFCPADSTPWGAGAWRAPSAGWAETAAGLLLEKALGVVSPLTPCARLLLD